MKHTHIALGALAIGLACAMAAHAQQARDAAKATPESPATVIGSVMSAPTTIAPARPLPGAIVTISGDGLPVPVSAVTDERGAFLLPRIPPSGYTLTATKPGYLPGAYGAQTTGRPGTTISLSPAAVVTATIALTKGAALTGVVRDEQGMPVSDVPIIVLEAGNILTQNRPLHESRNGRGTQFTDDRGVYRVHGLAPAGPSSRPSLPPTGPGPAVHAFGARPKSTPR